MKNLLYTLVLIAILLNCIQELVSQRCDKVYVSKNKACEIHLDIDTLPSCVSGATNDRESCEKLDCCWNAQAVQCYQKPQRCYVDLRSEKCPRKPGSNTNGIYSGFSVNGSFCHVSTLIILDPKEARLLGYIHDVGFPITNGCRGTWTYKVKRGTKDNCSVRIVDTDNSYTRHFVNQTLPEGKLRNGICVIEIKGRIYPFPYYPSSTKTQCSCHVDAWLQDKNEELAVSSQIKAYVERNENNSSCTQVLGNMVKRSWFEKVAPINRVEVDVVLKALTHLTNTEVIDDVTIGDAKVLLHNTKKVANYQFYEGIQTDSAENLIEKTVTGVNNLITRVPYLESDSAIYTDAPGEITTTKIEATTQAMKSEADNDLKLNLFETLEAVLGTVASHVQPENKTVALQALESRVDVKVVVANAENIEQFMNDSDFNLNHETQHNDEVQIEFFSEQQNAFDQKYEKFSAISIFYDYPTTGNISDERVVSDYLSVNVRGFTEIDTEKISVPVQFSLMRHNNIQIEGYEPTCVFLNTNSSFNDTWNEYGCTTLSNITDNVTTCFCNHTTHFAVLMKFTGSTVSEVHEQALELISIILGSLSVAALIVTLLVFVAYRRTLLKDRMIIHFNLVVALLGGIISLLLSTLLNSKVPSTTCFVGALASHFFFLATFFWYLVEGAYLFYKVVLVFQKKWVECLPKYAPIFAWISPLVIVILAYITSRQFTPTKNDDGSYNDSYYSPQTCFLTEDNGMIWAFLGPALVIIFVNFLILLRVFVIIYRSSSSSTRFANSRDSVRISSSLRRGARGALILMPILGLPWVIGLLYNLNNDNSPAGTIIGTAGAYLHVVLTSIQGILIFLFYCAYNADVRGAYALAAKRRKSMENINSYSNNQRKKSTFPLLFSRSNSVASQLNQVIQPSPNVVRRNQSMNYYGSQQTVITKYGRSSSMEGLQKDTITAK